MAYISHSETGAGAAGHDTQVFSAAGAAVIALPDAGFVRQADLTREGQDLVLKGPNGETVVVEGYFAAEPAPLLQAGGGETLTPALVQSFVKGAGPLHFAANATATDASPVGIVSETDGKATVTRTDGTTEDITVGTRIFEGDVIETGTDGAVNITFMDESTFAVSQDAKLAIDEYVFDPDAAAGSSDFSIVRGLFVFTSGLIGRDDPDDVHINTPMGSIGIRGTVIAGNLTTGEITVLEGAIVLKAFNGTEVTLAQQFETARFNPAGGGITHVGTLSHEAFESSFSAIRSVSPTLFTAIDNGSESGHEAAPGTAPPPAGTQAAPAPDGEAPVQGQEQTQPAPDSGDAIAPPPPASDPFFDGMQTQDFDANAGLGDAAGTGEFTAPLSLAETTSLIAPQPLSVSTSEPSPTTTTTTTTTTSTDSTILSPPASSGSGSGSSGPVFLDLRHISGTNGFIINGASGSAAHFGFGIAALGDLDADGFGDFAVTDSTALAGKYYLFDGVGTAAVTSLTISANNTTQPDIAAVGDFDGDGAVDFITGAPLADNIATDGGGVAIQGTSAFLLSGFAAGDHAGGTVSGIGDVNGDGFADAIFGAPGADNGGLNRGSAFVLFGDDSAGPMDASALSPTEGVRIDNVTDNEAFGNYVSGAGDFNNDGYGDFMVSKINGSTGAVEIFLGGTASALYDNIADAAYILTGVGTDGFDVPVMAMGDINGDGISDIAVADTLNDRIHILFGGGAVDTALGDGVNINGFTIFDSGGGTFEGGGGVGDFNGDGFDDAAIAVRNGTVADIYVIYGKAGMSGTLDVQSLYNMPELALHMTYDIGNTGQFEFNIGAAGDVNGDGFDDLLIGTPDANNGDGAATVVFGKPRDTDLATANPDMHAAGINGPADVVASSAGDALVGNAANNVLSNNNGSVFGNVAFRGGAGDDTIELYGTSFRNIDGGSGYDTLKFTGTGLNLDFSSLGSEKISGVEKLIMMNSNQTITLGIDDIFRLMQESDNNSLTISGNGDTTNRLVIDNNGNTVMATGTIVSATWFQTEFGDIAGGSSVGHSVSGGYDQFTVGGYTLQIESVLLDGTNPSQVI